MSAGLSFGALPAFADLSPDQQAMVMQSLQARAAEQQQAGSPDQLLYNRAGLGGGDNGFQPQPRGPGPETTGAVAREATHSLPAIAAMGTDAPTMEQPMLPPSPDHNVPPVPQAGPRDQGGPVPPAIPAPTPGPTQPAPQANPAAPGVGAVPLSMPSPMGLGVNAASIPSANTPRSAVSPTAAAQATAAGGGGSTDIFGKFLTGLQNPQVSDLLLNLGIGLMSQRGIGNGLAAGLSSYQKGSVGNLSQQLQQLKYMQEQKDRQSQLDYLTKSKGYSPEAAAAMVANPSLLSMENAAPHTVDVGGVRYAIPPGAGTDQSKWIPLGEAGVPLEKEVKRADALATVADQHGEELKPLTDPTDRAANGIQPGDNRPAWISSKGKVTFDNQNAPKVMAVRGPDGTTLQRVDPIANTATPVQGGPGPVDNSDVPAGADPQAYRRKMAEALVKEKTSATDRSLAAADAAPVLDRAEKAYRALSEAGGIGPFQASSANRFFEGARGHPNEVARQDYEAAAKELELMQAQIRMKGQGAITEGERKILAMTLPRLDAADPKTGMETFNGLRGQFSRAQSADTLPRAEPKPPQGAPADARQAKDGNWYVKRDGRYFRVQ